MSRVVACGPRTPLARARDLARRDGASAVWVGRRAVARRADIDRAVAWGLGARPVADVAWPGVPVVGAEETEIAVRRLLADGAPMVLVRRGRRIAGVVDAAAATMARPALSVVHRLDDLGEAHRWLLRVAAKTAESQGVSARAVGGIVRDFLLRRPAGDVDLVVDGDVAAYARRLAAEIRGRVGASPRSGVLSITDGTSPDGEPLARVDVAAPCRRAYAAPGTPPATRTASLDEDLAGRDFTIDAVALCLAPGEGRLVDLPGAQRDLAGRRIRPLHALAFVEDPARVFRAARCAARLGFRLDPMAMRSMRLALGVRAYPALAAARLWAELVETAADPDGWSALRRLARWGAFRLWDAQYRVTGRVTARLDAARRLADRTRAGAALDRAELACVALLLDQPSAVARRCLDRLDRRGACAARIGTALGDAHRLARQLGRRGPARPGAVDASRAGTGALGLAAAWLVADRIGRRRIARRLAVESRSKEKGEFR
jgi:tRNA nucleotidyltransferase/poly(A) polymerase